MPEYEAKTTQITLKPKGEPIFSEMATHIAIENEAAGEYVSVSQQRVGVDLGKIYIEPEEWPKLRDVIDHMIGSCES